jgi:xanthine dehydrogenase small subunit
MADLIQFLLNDRPVVTSQPPGLPVLDYLRQDAKLRGTKEGCREGGCGACTVLLGEWTGDRPVYQPMTACLLPLGELQGKHLVTIEGLNQPQLSPVQQAIVDGGATQCGFCTPGMVMAVTGQLLSTDRCADDRAIARILSGNLCRCTGYAALKRAVRDLLQRFQGITDLAGLVDQGVVPAYFLDVPQQLARLPVAPAPAVPEGGLWVAGGTEVYVETDLRLNQQPIQFLRGLPHLRGIQAEGGTIRLGALTTFADLETHPLIRQSLPAVPGFMAQIASWPIRTRATVGGNLVAASPIADVAVLLLALDAQLVLQQGTQQRSLALREFFRAYKLTARQPEEVLSAVVLPPQALRQQLHFEKVAKRKTLDCASVNSAIALQVEGNVIQQASLAMGGVAPIPLFLQTTSAYFRGKPITPEVIAGAFPLLQTEISPISDVRGSAAYKRLLARQLLIAHFTTLFPDSLQVRDLYAVS